jgi:putative oxidoreductase
METYAMDAGAMGIGLLVARLVIGLLMAAHGAQKMFGWFGGMGLGVTGEFFVQLGFRQGRAFAAMAALTEIVSGLLIALGLLGPIGPALMLSVMIVAAVTVHLRHGLFAMTNGIEVPLLYATAGVGFATTGFGRYSMDAMLGIAGALPSSFTWLALGLAVAGGIGNLAIRRPVSPQGR